METKILIDKAIGFIQTNPKENLSLQSIADHAGFSLTYFDALFRQHTGYSPVEYSRIYKLTRSALELRRTERSILDIALDFGYSCPESFTRAFKSYYGLTPSEYRQKHSESYVTWHDLSGKISITRFMKDFPELRAYDIDSALDYCFMHNPVKHAEDIIQMMVAETKILTLSDSAQPEHFIYISDYNSAEPAVTLVCENETDALSYLKLLAKKYSPSFTVRRSPECRWQSFDTEASRLGLTCRYGYDMIYPYTEITVPKYGGMNVRELCPEDMPAVKAFCQSGGCAECHVRAIQVHFDKKGNAGLRPHGLFIDGEMVCLAMPTLDKVREMKKYDIGAVFTAGKGCYDEAIELIWKYVIDMCLKEGVVIGNANARETSDPKDALSVAKSEKMGLVKIAINCRYTK